MDKRQMKTYEIKEGKHRSGWHFRPVFGGGVEFVSFRINRWAYDPIDAQQCEQWNKIWGYGAFPHHHYNSQRIVFRWCREPHTVEVAFYQYSSGQRLIVPIGYFKTREWITVHFIKPMFGYTLFPYHGGKAASPINYSVEIDVK